MGNLVLSRNRGEKVVIGDAITVTVLDIRGDKVKLGFEADKSVRIDREEVRQRIEQECRGPAAEAAKDAPE